MHLTPPRSSTGPRLVALPGALSSADDASLARAAAEGHPLAASLIWDRFSPMVRRMLLRSARPPSRRRGPRSRGVPSSVSADRPASRPRSPAQLRDRYHGARTRNRAASAPRPAFSASDRYRIAARNRELPRRSPGTQGALSPLRNPRRCSSRGARGFRAPPFRRDSSSPTSLRRWTSRSPLPSAASPRYRIDVATLVKRDPWLCEYLAAGIGPPGVLGHETRVLSQWKITIPR